MEDIHIPMPSPPASLSQKTKYAFAPTDWIGLEKNRKKKSIYKEFFRFVSTATNDCSLLAMEENWTGIDSKHR